MADGGVLIGWCHPGTVRGEFNDALCALLVRDATHDGHVTRRGGTVGVRSGPRIAEARNQIVAAFLAMDDEAAPEWLWMVDTDMVFTADCLDRMLKTADAGECPIVGGLCYATADRPVMFRVTGSVVERVVEWSPGELVDVDATGAACLLIHRSVLAALREVDPDGAYPWFVEGATTSRGELLGEDTAFCMRARSLGFRIAVDTSIRVGHVKSTVIGEVA